MQKKNKLGRKPSEDKKIPVVTFLPTSFFTALGCSGELLDKKRKMAEKLYRMAENEVKKKKEKAAKKSEPIYIPDVQES